MNTPQYCIECKRPTLVKEGSLFCKWHDDKLRSAKKAVEPIAVKSEKQTKNDKLFALLSAKYRAEHPICEANLPGCTKATEDTHHKKGRGKHLLDPKYFLACCRSCHRTITDNSALAIALGLSLSRLSVETETPSIK